MKRLAPVAKGYASFIGELKIRIAAARLQAGRAVNRELVLLYWDIGRGIVEKQRTLGWGESVVEMVAADLRREFPQMTGFSERNVWDMRRLYETYTAPATLAAAGQAAGRQPTNLFLRQPVAELAGRSKISAATDKPVRVSAAEILRRAVAEIPWGQNLLLLNKLRDAGARLYYLHATARFGWSRNVLLHQIKGRAYERSLRPGKAHNFPGALPADLAEQADEMLKSSYNLEFLGLGRAVKERELEDRLVGRLRDFILELGYGFCFVARQLAAAIGPAQARP